MHEFSFERSPPQCSFSRNILLNYAIYNPDMGYTQGMSDLLAPLLSTIQDEVDTFWSFVGLMEFSLFATTPTDKSMDISLVGFFFFSLIAEGVFLSYFVVPLASTV